MTVTNSKNCPVTKLGTSVLNVLSVVSNMAWLKDLLLNVINIVKLKKHLFPYICFY